MNVVNKGRQKADRRYDERNLTDPADTLALY